MYYYYDFVLETGTSPMLHSPHTTTTSTSNHAMHELALLWPTILPGWVISRVRRGQHPEYIRADYGQEAVGGSLTIFLSLL